jgi:predicted nucleotidyltransferase
MSKQRSGWRAWAVVIIARYALAQGMHYMNGVERVHRLTIEAVLAALAWAGLFRHCSWPLALVASMAVAHAANLAANGHLCALFKHDLSWFGFYRKWADFAAYVDGIQRRLTARPCAGLESAEVYGSLTRGTFGPDSDLDIRFIAKPGVRNAWSVCNRVWEERVRALLFGFPIDAYMFRTREETARKMNVREERPATLYSASGPAAAVRFREQVQPYKP